MPTCGAKTNDGKKCRRSVGKAGQRCKAHSDTSPERLIATIFSVCGKVMKVIDTAQGVQWAYEHLWPYVEPLWESGVFCPESFWLDGIASPARGHGPIDKAPQHLKAAVKQMQDARAAIESRLRAYSPDERERIADAYEKVLTALLAKHPEVGDARPANAT